MAHEDKRSTTPKPELFFGLVGGVGTDLEKVISALKKALATVEYDLDIVRLSGLLRDIDRFKNLPTKYVDDYIEAHMSAGDELRSTTGRADALAIFAVGKIRSIRKNAGKAAGETIANKAFLFRSLKNPEEVEALRRIYGSSFYLISAYTSLQDKRVSLAKQIAKSRNTFPFSQFLKRADHLIDRDQEEVGNKSGQNTRDSFHRADLFVDTKDPELLQRSINRFVELLFGYSFHTPSIDEYAMFHAQAAALRSAELGRQVGVAIATRHGDIVAVGCNEVPKAGGGLYWFGDSPDHREFYSGMDGIEEQKRNLIAETIRFLKEKSWLEQSKAELSTDELVKLAIDPDQPVIPKDAKIRSLIEFGRAVHGEMAALSDAAKRGVAINSCIMYVTTFPCHLCARHIVAAGIARLVYIEPYAKSLAAELYPDSIAVDGECTSGEQVSFSPFVGIAPRQYMDLFTAGKRKKSDGTVVEFVSKTALPKFSQRASVYLENEMAAFKNLIATMKSSGLINKEANDGGVGETDNRRG